MGEENKPQRLRHSGLHAKCRKRLDHRIDQLAAAVEDEIRAALGDGGDDAPIQPHRIVRPTKAFTSYKPRNPANNERKNRQSNQNKKPYYPRLHVPD